MTRGKFNYGTLCVLTVASTLFVCIHGKGYDGNFGRIRAHPYPRNEMTVADLFGSDNNWILERFLEEEAAEGRSLQVGKHPKLSEDNRNFAVHPGYPSYYNPELRFVENEIDRQIERLFSKDELNNEEIAEDPFETKPEETPEEAAGKEKQGVKQFKTKLGESVKTALTEKDMQEKKESIIKEEKIKDIYFTAIAAGSSALCVFLIVCAGICYHKLQRKVKSAEDVEYPAYGVTGPGKEISPTSGVDRKLLQNAQMYHYQHQKQQMIAFDSHQNGSSGRNRLPSEEDSDEGEEGDYTVYECPGLAPTGEMEVRNPMFSDDQTTPKASNK